MVEGGWGGGRTGGSDEAIRKEGLMGLSRKGYLVEGWVSWVGFGRGGGGGGGWDGGVAYAEAGYEDVERVGFGGGFGAVGAHGDDGLRVGAGGGVRGSREEGVGSRLNFFSTVYIMFRKLSDTPRLVRLTRRLWCVVLDCAWCEPIWENEADVYSARPLLAYMLDN